MSYRVKTVSELTGIPRSTLLAWERRYHLFEPGRSDGGYRLYSDAEVDILRQLKAQVEAGLSISEAISRLGRLPAPSSPSPSPAPPVPTEPWGPILRHLLAFDRASATPALRRVESLPFEAAVDTIWSPMLAEVGDRWEAGEITVAQEHYVAGVAREHLAGMLHSLDAGLGDGPRALLACFPGEHHDLPLLLVAVRLAVRGWRLLWLGADVPTADLCAACALDEPDVVCLSTTRTDATREVIQAVHQVRRCLPTRVTLAVGGAGIPTAELPEGVWVCRSVEELVERQAGRRGR
jgi:DNA-binding transcriptional MerR regulator